MTKLKPQISLIIALFLLVGCATPIVFNPAELRGLDENQLCNLLYNYGEEFNLVNEINARQVNCDPVYRQCLSEGHTKGKKLKQCMANYNQLIVQQQQQQQMVNQCKQATRGAYNPTAPLGEFYRHRGRVAACDMIATNPQAYQQTIQSLDAADYNDRMQQQMMMQNNQQVFCSQMGHGIICRRM